YGYFFNEVDNRLLRRSVVPRRQRILGLSDGRRESQRAKEGGGEEVLFVCGFHCGCFRWLILRIVAPGRSAECEPTWPSRRPRSRLQLELMEFLRRGTVVA